eukprot:2147438-Lingulodinium_polyedra.AAC.1
MANHTRNLALLPAQVVRAAVSEARVGEPPRSLTPVEAAQVGLCWRVARRIAWMAAGNDYDTFAT